MKHNQNNTHWLKLVKAIVLCQTAGILGSFFTVKNIPGWYSSLIKPWFTPPNWIFGPVWTFLYLLMGISIYKIWLHQNAYNTNKIQGIFYLQLFINFFWSVVFFGNKNIFAGLLVIVLLWINILVYILLSWKFDKNSSLLMIPYLVWVSFASVLNFALYQLN